MIKILFKTSDKNWIIQKLHGHKKIILTLYLIYFTKITYSKVQFQDFPGGTVETGPPASAGDTGSSPGLGRSHMPWSS